MTHIDDLPSGRSARALMPLETQPRCSEVHVGGAAAGALCLVGLGTHRGAVCVPLRLYINIIYDIINIETY